MDYVLKESDYNKFPNQFRKVDVVDTSNGGSIGVVWREFLSNGDTTIIPNVKGFVSRGSNIYILVSDSKSYGDEFNFNSWVRRHSGKDVTALTYADMFPGGQMPRPIGGVLEELEDLTYPSSSSTVSRPTFPSMSVSDEPFYGTQVIDEDGIFALEGNGHFFDVPADGGKYSLGSGSDNAFVLASKGVSRRHCEFRVMDDKLLVKDCNSTNGTKIDGRRIPVGSWYRVADGSSIKLGSVTLQFNYKED